MKAAVSKSLTDSVLSGLLVCGTCDGSISIIGGKEKRTKNGRVDYRTYGCTNHFRRGDQFCMNNKTTSRLKLEQKVIDGLQLEVLRPEAVERFIQRMTRLVR